MNAFFASCEQIKNPDLIGKPVIVGGNSRRSVVSAASYEARKLGVHAAMPYFKAYELCPDGVYLPVDMEYYVKTSRKIFKLLEKWTYCIEKVGIDEGFIDITGAIQLFGEPKEIAHLIINQIKTEIGIDCTIGIGRTKSVAKLASSLAKPTDKKGFSTGFIADNGVLEIKPHETDNFLKQLPIKLLYGVGKKTNEKLHRLGINTVNDFLNTPKNAIIALLGEVIFEKIYKLSKGIDFEKVEYNYILPKSIGREITLYENTRDFETLNDVLVALCDDVTHQQRMLNIGTKSIVLIIKTASHISSSHSKLLNQPTNVSYKVLKIAQELLKTWLKENDEEIRLIGIQSTKFAKTDEGKTETLTLFEFINDDFIKTSKFRQIDKIIDNAKHKFNEEEFVQNKLKLRVGFVDNR